MLTTTTTTTTTTTGTTTTSTSTGGGSASSSGSTTTTSYPGGNVKLVLSENVESTTCRATCTATCNSRAPEKPKIVGPVRVPAKVLHLRNDFLLEMSTWCPFQLEKYLRDALRPAVFMNEATFQCGFDGVKLSPGATRMLTMPNAGGSSVWSEVMSFEVLRRTLQARLLKTEMELEYWHPNSKITDYSVTLFDLTVGVSVTRAMKFRGRFTFADAETLLRKKLNGVVHSTRNVTDSFHKQILHVWAKSSSVAKLVRAAYRKMPPELKANTVVVVTVVNNADWLFFEPAKKKM